MRTIIAALLILPTIALAADAPTGTTVPMPQRVLILPFGPLGEAKPNWLGAAVQQNLLTELSRTPSLQPITIKTTEPVIDLEGALKAGRDKGASLVIFGSYQFAEKDIRFTGQVADVQRGVILTGVKATGNLRELFSLEDSLAAQIKTALGQQPLEKREVIVQVPQHVKDMLQPPMRQPPQRDWNEEDVAPVPNRLWDDDGGYWRHRYAGYPGFHFPIFIVPATPTQPQRWPGFHPPPQRSTGGVVGADGRWKTNPDGSIVGRRTFPVVP